MSLDLIVEEEVKSHRKESEQERKSSGSSSSSSSEESSSVSSETSDERKAREAQERQKEYVQTIQKAIDDTTDYQELLNNQIKEFYSLKQEQEADRQEEFANKLLRPKNRNALVEDNHEENKQRSKPKSLAGAKSDPGRIMFQSQFGKTDSQLKLKESNNEEKRR